MPKKKTTTIKEVDYKNAFVPLAGEEDIMIPKKVLEINKRGVHKIINTLTNKGNLRKANKKYVVHLVPSDNFVSKKSAKAQSTSLIREIHKKTYLRYAKEYDKLGNEINQLTKEKNLARGNKRKALEKKIDDYDKKHSNLYDTHIRHNHDYQTGLKDFANDHKTFFV
jgi:polyhydroxyalkanoate synthesis regulator phasin